MARFTKESLLALRQRVDLAEVIGQHVPLKRAGATYKGLCPFHDEKTPSFVIGRGDAHYHCFGCGAHGDAIQFLMQHLRLSFADAVQQLADRFHVVLEKQEADSTKETNRASLKEAHEAACDFYHAYLLYSKEAAHAIDYLAHRLIDREFINFFQLGLSPKRAGLFRKVMHERGFSDEILIEAGLLSNTQGKIKDFFIDRIMFPIRDAQGAVIGFSARKLSENAFGGKYINTKETALFKKSRLLFGLSFCRKRIAKQKQAIIVEGALDALRLIFHGFDCTVAALGTAFGEEHIRELVQLGVSRVFLLFDGDAAGKEAAVKVGNLFQKKGVDVLVAGLKSGVDPDTLLVQEGPMGIMKALQDATEYLHFLYGHLKANANIDSPAEKNKILLETVQKIREWENPVMVHESLKKLAQVAQVPQELLDASAIAPAAFYLQKKAAIDSPQKIDPHRILEADFLRWLLLYGSTELTHLAKTNIKVEDLSNQVAKKVYAYFLERCSESGVDLLLLATEVDDEDLQPFLAELSHKKINKEKAYDGLFEAIRKIKERNWMIEREEIKTKIHNANSSEEELMALVERFDRIKKSPPTVELSNIS
jgi:DNA primase